MKPRLPRLRQGSGMTGNMEEIHPPMMGAPNGLLGSGGIPGRPATRKIARNRPERTEYRPK